MVYAEKKCEDERMRFCASCDEDLELRWKDERKGGRIRGFPKQ